MRYRTILVDPPWPQRLSGRRQRAKGGAAAALAYPTMTLDQIAALPVGALAEDDAHVWLWTTNQFLRHGFDCLDAWGFRYLAPVHWLKPSGLGNWFIHRTQTVLFGYRSRCVFPAERYLPNVFASGDPVRHSQKPDCSYDYIERISIAPRVELFARRQRPGWHTWGNEAPSCVDLGPSWRVGA